MDRESFIKAVQASNESLSKQIDELIKNNIKSNNLSVISDVHRKFTKGFSIVKCRKMDAEFSQIPPLL
ncbi:hypothetical protein UA32_11840 [Photobacterium angustum]|uniref:Uncharacterized protein n=1 Tax=Photobacterium angustum TaxID=661 RepID=A0ABX5H2A3_PHOAN|nr:hypothetical protein [Photobacterium angustum]KJG37651.1 hypothetical protein UA32_11840 [Photobacterium angustum]PSX07108.1 hypothetical protein C0W27_16185 [Photobacterium angustum]